jgi:hypothetical protein
VGNENLAAALEVASAGMSDAAPAADAPATESAPMPTPSGQPSVDPATEAKPAPTPTVDRITLEKLRERQAAKQPQRQQAPVDPEYEAWKAARSMQPSNARMVDVDALMRDPAGTLAKAGVDDGTPLLNNLTKQYVTPDAAVLEAKIDAKLKAAEERAARAESAVEQIKQERAARAQERDYTNTMQQFVTLSGTAEKFPQLARLDPEMREEWGIQKANYLLAQGIKEFSIEEVAHLLETDLSKLSGPLGRDQAPGGATPTPSQQATNGSAPKRAATITSDAASSTTATPGRMTERQRLAAAMEVARRG